MVRVTRKQDKHKKEKAMTVPQLRKSFEHIDSFINTKKPDVDSFMKEWKKVFGKEVSREAASDYLKVCESKKSRQSRKSTMSGGGAVAITPAPLGYDLRAGASLPYGSFPEYVSSGFGFANNPSFSNTTESVPFPLPPADSGSNRFVKLGGGKRKTKKTRKTKQRGGAVSIAANAAEFMSRPVLAPAGAPTHLYMTQMAAKGVTGFATANPENHTFNFSQNPTTYSASVSAKF
jgi:hypothetical protein